MKRSEIHEMTNTELVMILCKTYGKQTRTAIENAQKVIEELGARSLVYEEDLEEEFFQNVRR